MTKLQCSAVRCEYNKNQNCCRPDIQIGGGESAKCSDQTCCDSFRERHCESCNAVSYSQPDEHLQIACTASHCRYNSLGACIAKSVQISGVNASKRQGTQCETFSCNKHSGC